jgi:hypothetical protein
VAAQEVLKRQLELSRVSISHGGVMGDVNEKHVIAVLRSHLPRRYQVSSAIILDSAGNTSDQIDVVVFDEQYTPTLLDQQDHRFVPSEAVYAVFEVKPTINKSYLQYAANKAESVRKLKRTSIEIHHAGGVYPAKPLFPIIAGIVATDLEWKSGFGPTFLDIYRGLRDDRFLDCGLAVSGHHFDSYDGSGNPLVFSGDGSFAFFLFRLLQKLQTLGTVPAVDWTRYGMILSKKSSKR